MSSNNGVYGKYRRSIFERDKYTCQICGVIGHAVRNKGPSGSVTYTHHTDIDGVYLSIDHIYPRCAGGTNVKENLRCLCTKCNTMKGVKITNGDLNALA